MFFEKNMHSAGINSLSTGKCKTIFETSILNDILSVYLLCTFHEIVHGLMAMISSQSWFSYWIGVLKQQVIIWVIAGKYLCNYMTSLG